MNRSDNVAVACRRSDHGISRRSFLHGAVAGGTAFGGFARLFAAESAAVAVKQHKHVILLFMSGGPSQFETWDPKPGRPTGGPHMTIPTSLPGVHFDEFMPNLARLADKMITVRSMTSRFGEHAEGCRYVQTAHRPAPVTASAPHWLSVCSHQLPSARSELPSYVMLGQENGEFAAPLAGHLGAAFQALICPGNGLGPQDLPAASPDEVAALAERERLRSRIGAAFAESRDPAMVNAHDVSFRRMGDLIKGRGLFDISRAPAKERERYGNSRLGRDCLMARRLVESGVSFVRVQHQNGLAWDKHRRAFESQRHITAEFDTAAGALIDDLRSGGLWKDTLVVLMGEFGRTPEIQGQGPPGRNHWTKSWSLSFGGCGLKEGVVIGSTNADGTEIKDRPVTVPDLFCTFYKALGINGHKELMVAGRPIPLIEDKLGAPLTEVH
jgi:hypothetical protein